MRPNNVRNAIKKACLVLPFHVCGGGGLRNDENESVAGLSFADATIVGDEEAIPKLVEESLGCFEFVCCKPKKADDAFVCEADDEADEADDAFVCCKTADELGERARRMDGKQLSGFMLFVYFCLTFFTSCAVLVFCF